VSKYESGERRLDLMELRDVCETMGVSVVNFVRRFDLAVKRIECWAFSRPISSCRRSTCRC